MKKTAFLLMVSLVFLSFGCAANKISTTAEKNPQLTKKNAKDYDANPRKLRKMYRAAMSDMKTIGIALDSYAEDWGEFPDVNSMTELKKINGDIFVPHYIKYLPLDPWGNEYLIKSKNDNYWLGCGGSDGVFSGFDQEGLYELAPGKDIVFHNSLFVYAAKIW